MTTFLFNRIMMNLLGEDGVAAITIIIYTQFLLTALFIGFSVGVAPVISYNYGKQDDGRLRKIFSVCMRYIILVSIVIFGTAIAFGFPLVSLFSERGTYVYEIARDGFLIFPFSFLFCGLILVFLLILPEFMGVTGGVAGSTDCGAVYNGGGFGFSLSK